jgi:hypothetical protein
MNFAGNIRIDDDIAKAFFCCDAKRCKGACCTFPGDSGAPLLEGEIELMKQNFNSAKVYLSERNLEYIKKFNYFEGNLGERTTVCINRRDCVFVYYEDDIARCAYEKAYFEGKSSFWKPISCHLFPIRVSRFEENYLYYMQIEECKTARKFGNKNRIHLITCLKDALIRAFGEQWYCELEGLVKK